MIAFRQLGPDFDGRVAQLVTYCLLVTRMNMAVHKAKVLTGAKVLLNIKAATIISQAFACMHEWQ